MTRINQIECALEQIDGGAFQKLAEAYLMRKFHLTSLTALGSQPGTNKVCVGVPDAYGTLENSDYYIAFTTAQRGSVCKLEKDINDCIVSIPANERSSSVVVCCHTCWRLTPEEEKRLKGLSTNVQLIGPKTLAEDLSTRPYDDLACNHLNVPLPSVSLQTIDEFVNREDRSGYATPQSGELRDRSSELADLLQLLSETQVVVMSGPSGCGKTRLALEVIRRVSSESHTKALVLRGFIASDSDVIFSELADGPIILMVDDANDVSNLNIVAEAALQNNRLKLILTVRDYALEKVKKMLNGRLWLKQYSLQVLRRETISRVLEEDYEIKNGTLRERIVDIARGNLRLAVMAAVKAKGDEISTLVNAYDVLDLFLSNATNDLCEDEIDFLTTVAVCSPVDLQKGDVAYELLVKKGFSAYEMKTIARHFEERDILDRIEDAQGNVAIRFEQQNLRDYCIFKGLVKDGSVSLKSLLVSGDERDFQKAVQDINVLLGIFGDTSTKQFVQKEATEAWKTLASASKHRKEQFMAAVYPLIPQEALDFAIEQLDVEVSAAQPIDWQECDKAPVGQCLLPFEILCRMKGTRYFEIALPYIVDCIEHGTGDSSSYKSALELYLALSFTSSRNKFKDEILLLDTLRQKLPSDKSGNIGGFLLRIAGKYLDRQVTWIEQGAKSGIIWNSMRLDSSEALSELRAMAISALCIFLQDETTCETAANTLIPYIRFPYGDDGEESETYAIFVSDLRAFMQGIAREPPMRFAAMRLMVFGCQSADRLSSNVGCSIRRFVPDDVTRCFKVIDLIEQQGEAETELETWRDDWLVGVAKVLGEFAVRDPGYQLDISEALSVLLDAAVQSGKSCQCILRIFSVFYIVPTNIVMPTRAVLKKVMSRMGREWTEMMARQLNCVQLNFQLARSAEAVELDENAREWLTSHVDANTVLRLDEITAIANYYPEFAVSYTHAAGPVLHDNQHVARWFFCNQGLSKEFSNRLEKCFGQDVDLLERIYLAHASNSGFDYAGGVFLYLWSLDCRFVKKLMTEISSADRGQMGEGIKRLAKVVLTENPNGELTKAIRLIGKLPRASFMGPLWVMELLTECEHQHSDSEFDVKEFISEEIVHNAADEEYVKLFSSAIGDFTWAELEEFLLDVLSKNPEGTLLGLVPLEVSSWVGSVDEGLAPMYYQQSEMLERIYEGLPKEAAFTKHRRYLRSEINGCSQDAKMEAWRTFHEL